MIPTGQDSLRTRSTLEVEGKTYSYYSLSKAGEALGDVSRLPFSMKVLLENLLRFEDGETVTRDDLQCMDHGQAEIGIIDARAVATLAFDHEQPAIDLLTPVHPRGILLADEATLGEADAVQLRRVAFEPEQVTQLRAPFADA